MIFGSNKNKKICFWNLLNFSLLWIKIMNLFFPIITNRMIHKNLHPHFVELGCRILNDETRKYSFIMKYYLFTFMKTWKLKSISHFYSLFRQETRRSRKLWCQRKWRFNKKCNCDWKNPNRSFKQEFRWWNSTKTKRYKK